MVGPIEEVIAKAEKMGVRYKRRGCSQTAHDETMLGRCAHVRASGLFTPSMRRRRDMAGKILLEVVTPEKLLLSQQVDEVIAPGSEGEFGALWELSFPF